jgi:PAS domain S-box-containing protein
VARSPVRSPHSVAGESPDGAVRAIARACFLSAAITALATAAVLGFARSSLGPGTGPLLVVSLLVYAVAVAWTWQRSARQSFPVNAALYTAAVGAMLLSGAIGLALQDGVHNPTLGLLALVVCIVCAVANVRAGAALALFAIAELAVLGWLQWRAAPRPDAMQPLLLELLLQGLVVGGGLGAGTLTGRVVHHYLHAAAAREKRSRDLLRLAADWYWEQDRDFRFTVIADPRGPAGAPDGEHRLGRRPWELPDIGLDDAQLDALRADMEAHRAFSNVISRRIDGSGRLRMHSVSGEPKFTAEGVFDGYWGVARDVTDERLAQRAFASSETRYRELFERSPSPLFLHRRGVIFDANPAAARLFGYPDAASMAGLEVTRLHPASERQRIVDRVDALERLPVGLGLPVQDFQAISRDGRPISVQGTGVRVSAAGGPAALTLLFDITARQAAQAALRRSEALLSHLFATSPDCIALSEIESGRHTMVNAAFTRLTGYEAHEVVGRTATELGLWQDLRDRERLRAAMTESGRIDEMPAMLLKRNGGSASVLISAARFEMDGRAYMVVNARDVTLTERTRLEHAAMFERASIGIALTRERVFVQANPRFEAIFGWSPGSLAGEPGSAVWPDADEYARISAVAGPLLAAGEPFETEREMKRRDGSRFWCRLLGQAVDPMRPSFGGTIWIADDVSERHRLDAALQAARDAAEAASGAKSAFLANTSHEIRTPLNGVLGLARLALRDNVDPALQRQYLEQIFESARGLEGILSDILDFSKIEAGKFTLETSVFEPRETLAAVHASYRSLAEAKGLAFELAIDPALPLRVEGDPVRVRQILGNFITNAVKFTDRGSVRIEAGPSGRGVRLAVVDTGRGVPDAVQAQLFQPFSQGDATTTRRVGGTGLGLSICRQLARMMGGDVGMSSGVGAGSTFWADLPLPTALPASEQAAHDSGEGERLRHARVLLVEDNPVNMMVAAATLAQWGVDVEEARDGRAAIQAVEAAARRGRPFDLILMDVQMPVMSGHEAALELRKAWSASALPIIALTAAALVSEREQALAAGMNDFLTKPIDASKLRRTLARHVRRSPGTEAVDTR